MITINQLSMAYGEKLLFYDVTLILSNQKRYALVGANGAGKSTFLKLLMGTEEPIAGSLSIPKSASVGWLKQDQFRYENTIITDIVLQGKPALWEAMQEKEKLLAANQWDEKNVNRFSKLEETIAHLNGYTAEGLAEKLLTGLGIQPEYHKKPLSTLSGGFKLRVLLAQALFQEPDILLLDEPTNHLDVISIQWLEQYLKNEFQGLLLFISHDVAFIDRLADNILDVDYGEIRQYSGNYEKFLAEKKLIEEQKLHEKQHAELKVAEMQRFVDKFRASSSRAKQAQSRLKMIEKIEIPDIKKSSRLTPHFNFNPLRPSGKQVLKVRHLAKDFKNKKLFQDLSFEIKRGEKVAIVGENGIGKSTLIKLLLGKIPADHGDFEWGYETQISYFSQDHHDLLNKKASVLEWLTNQVNVASEQTIRKVLAQVLFTKDEVQKDILALSGGEAARLLLAKLILESPNVLVLDEPTNHLDIEANDSLANALRNYSGTLLFVSHDRHFINKIANRILFISHHKKLQDVKRLDNITFN
ncbi:putative transporter fused subunits of ABC superfamily: ATP-binding components [Candidatus Rickettsiella viridis]|uniref:Probable ATP-binding protein YbiT n=1 Tax=Candidatus Rickettsiella viridis TaxID=676208 RepID=A0A2Z5UUN2_9COXI|nr:ABC-F family ATP-binding cassette domain-containing protein [Candidatus Rickettsiella viridis]BBB15184.1 putative transporter fused subunits of ABC superfamily: ATP-binding components [Candidatus Rickettsiella viridis]